MIMKLQGGRTELRHNAGMPNIASVLKAEIARVARKQVRGETAALKKAVSSYRSQIAALKRRVQVIERTLRQLTRASSKSDSAPEEAPSSQGVRFSAKGLASHRRRLGLSADEVGLLVGASGQSVYLWERGKARPRAASLAAIAALRSLGKSQAAQIVARRRRS